MLWALYKPEASAKGTSQLPAPCKPENALRWRFRLVDTCCGRYTSLKRQRRGRANYGRVASLKRQRRGRANYGRVASLKRHEGKMPKAYASGLWFWTILKFKDVFHCAREAFIVVQPPLAAALCPPILANGMRPGRLKKFLQLARAPGFELVHHVFRFPASSGDDDVNMVGPAVDRVQMPAATVAMLSDRVLDEFPLRGVQIERRFGHERSGDFFEVRVRRKKLAWLRDPTSFITGSQVPYIVHVKK